MYKITQSPVLAPRVWSEPSNAPKRQRDLVYMFEPHIFIHANVLHLKFNPCTIIKNVKVSFSTEVTING